jgi:GNAT superfamily N-acetyltransferase
MSIANSISRLTEYYWRHGLAATLRRAGVAGKRALFAGRMVVFYCDLDDRRLPQVNIPKALNVKRVQVPTELSTEHFQAITGFWNRKLASQNIRERFEKGASLWLVECEGQLAGYSWTIRGRAIAAYYFPIAKDDVQLFDFYVFPKFRGRTILWFLVVYILQTMRAEGAVRVFGDVAEWNEPSLSFYKMTPFRVLGLVSTYKIFGQVLTCWAANEPADGKQKGAARRDRATKALRSNE